jgi:hypothetical protein
VVTLLPSPGVLARIGIGGPHTANSSDLALARSIRRRHSDRRPMVAAWPIDRGRIAALEAAAAAEGASLHVVAEAQRARLSEAAVRAQASESSNGRYQEDLRAWTTDRPRGAGVPSHTLVARFLGTVPLRDFAAGGETGLDPGLGDDRFVDYVVLATQGDDLIDWIRAGLATSAVWLTATAGGLAASAISDVVEAAEARALVAGLLPEPGHPQLVFRVAVDAQPTPPPASPRRRPSEVIEVDPPVS